MFQSFSALTTTGFTTLESYPSGVSQIFLIILMVIGGYAAWRMLYAFICLLRAGEAGEGISGVRRLFRPIIWLAVMVGLGLALGAVQLVPYLEVVGGSFRSGEAAASLEQVLGWAYPPRRLITFGVPNFFGGPTHVSGHNVTSQSLELLEYVGLSEVMNTPARDLTLVNQKRLEVARALATKPELLLLDEMMAGLNQTEVAEAMQLITSIKDRGITVVMIEHVMKAIMNVCDRIIVLHHGQKIAEGTPQEIASSEKVIEVYLGE